MVVHAAFGGSTNLLLHIPAIAHAAGLKRPTVEDWIVSQPPRAAAGQRAAERPDPSSHRAGVPGRRRAGSDAAPAASGPARYATCSRSPARPWAKTWIGGRTSERRARFRELLRQLDGVDPDEVILSPEAAANAGMTGTLVFPRGNLAPEGSVVKATAIDPSVVRCRRRLSPRRARRACL